MFTNLAIVWGAHIVPLLTIIPRRVHKDSAITDIYI